MSNSIVSHSPGDVVVGEIWCDLPETRAAKELVPQSELHMVPRDQGAFCSTAAFFRESMRRDAMTGIRVRFALQIPSSC